MSERLLARVRRICLALPDTSERLSHNEPTFFAGKKVFVMFADNHHGDGRVAVWLPGTLEDQESRIAEDPQKFFRPPYVGPRGWLGVILKHVSVAELSLLIEAAYERVRAPRPKPKRRTR
jgi:hypothetical protein